MKVALQTCGRHYQLAHYVNSKGKVCILFFDKFTYYFAGEIMDANKNAHLNVGGTTKPVTGIIGASC